MSKLDFAFLVAYLILASTKSIPLSLWVLFINFLVFSDNFDFVALREAVEQINGVYITEASGGITEENVLDYAHCGVDYVSMGALTHSVRSLDMSLKAVNP